MRRSKGALSLLILLLGITTMACRLFSGGDVAEPVATVEQTVVPTVESEAEADGVAATVTGEAVPEEENVEVMPTAAIPATAVAGAVQDNLAANDGTPSELLDLSSVASDLDFESYRFYMVMAFEGIDAQGDTFSQNIEAEVAFSADPRSVSVIMRMEGIEQAGQLGQLVTTQIGDTNYMVMPGLGCVTTEANENNLLDNTLLTGLLDPDLLLQDLRGAHLVGEEVVNDIPTYVYAFDKSFLDTKDQVEWAEGRLYVAKSEGYMVRLVMDGEGALDLLRDGSNQLGTLHVEFDLSDVNQPVEIGVPAECGGEAGSGLAWPVLEDAFNVSSFSGVLSYQSEATLDDALAFYADAFEVAGWEEDEGQALSMSGTTILTYVRDGETITLSISENSQAGSLYVLISDEDSR